jgi:hypothetical protein
VGGAIRKGRLYPDMPYALSRRIPYKIYPLSYSLMIAMCLAYEHTCFRVAPKHTNANSKPTEATLTEADVRRNLRHIQMDSSG